ncbi:hypothetical protein C8Q70DRAFT_758999 [Cubamyces menziesii]|nr:hypothetical protein C8Q70DRAFT_758999 [Cubamyces menziesii]
MVLPTFSRTDKYVLVNRGSGTALTLVDVDGVPALAMKELQYENNQMWHFVKTTQGHAIQCFQRARDGKAMYVGTTGRIGQNTPIVACATPLSWVVILYQGQGLYIMWPESEFCMDLAWMNGQVTGNITIGLRGNQKGQPFDNALWCYSCIGEPAGDLPVPGREKNDGHAPQGGANFPNTAIHILTNTQHKTILEVERSTSLVKCCPRQQGAYQQWRFIPLGAGYIIESCGKSPNGEPLYLAVDGHATPGGSVIVSRYPASWRVEYNMSSVRLFWPTTNLVASARSAGTNDCVVLAEYDKGLLSKWDDAIVEDTVVVLNPDAA